MPYNGAYNTPNSHRTPYKVHQSLGYCSTKTGKTKSAGEKAASTYTLIHGSKEEQN
jgi:hypothetical protein